jgi:hypothetical protein
VANDVSDGEVFGSSNNSVLFVSKGSTSSHQGTKSSVATAVMSELAAKVGKV